MKRKIVFIHMLNNYTGSPNVLAVVIDELLKKGYEIELITSRSEGFLSNIEGIKYNYTCYKWKQSKLTTFLLFLFAHIQIFIRVLTKKNQGELYYINTILPFSAALACYFTQKRFIYHCHENMQEKKPFYGIYRNVYKWVNQKSIFVSHYVQSKAVGCREGKVIYNGLSQEFTKAVSKTKNCNLKEQTILMVCSLRKYKGVYEFIETAQKMPEHSFVLVLSETENEVSKFIKGVKTSTNLKFCSKQDNLHPFYDNAKILLSLSHPNGWIETFGLTILEGMVYGIPAIVPNVGGPIELIEDGKEGYTINPKNIDSIIESIHKITKDEEIYNQFSNNALKKSKQFEMITMTTEIEEYIER